MNQLSVLEHLKSVRKSYRWSIDDDGSIVGEPVNKTNARFRKYNPFTAFARTSRLGQYDRGRTKYVLDNLGVPSNLQQSLIDAVNGSTNRGQAQVLRGRIRATLGL